MPLGHPKGRAPAFRGRAVLSTAWPFIVLPRSYAPRIDRAPLCAPALLLLSCVKRLISLTGYSNTSGLCWCAVGVVSGKHTKLRPLL